MFPKYLESRLTFGAILFGEVAGIESPLLTVGVLHQRKVDGG